MRFEVRGDRIALFLCGLAFAWGAIYSLFAAIYEELVNVDVVMIKGGYYCATLTNALFNPVVNSIPWGFLFLLFALLSVVFITISLAS